MDLNCSLLCHEHVQLSKFPFDDANIGSKKGIAEPSYLTYYIWSFRTGAFIGVHGSHPTLHKLGFLHPVKVHRMALSQQKLRVQKPCDLWFRHCHSN
jgi:hypothetical protein